MTAPLDPAAVRALATDALARADDPALPREPWTTGEDGPPFYMGLYAVVAPHIDGDGNYVVLTPNPNFPVEVISRFIASARTDVPALARAALDMADDLATLAAAYRAHCATVDQLRAEIFGPVLTPERVEDFVRLSREDHEKAHPGVAAIVERWAK